jgi:hypothetical protein
MSVRKKESCEKERMSRNEKTKPSFTKNMLCYFGYKSRVKIAETE